jgi:hypothetical protein
MRESITADMSSSVAENSLCWCDGRNRRKARETPLLDDLAVTFCESCIGGQILHGTREALEYGEDYSARKVSPDRGGLSDRMHPFVDRSALHDETDTFENPDV